MEGNIGKDNLEKLSKIRDELRSEHLAGKSQRLAHFIDSRFETILLNDHPFATVLRRQLKYEGGQLTDGFYQRAANKIIEEGLIIDDDI